MVQAIIKLNEHQDRILNIVKGKYGFKNKSEAMNYIIDKFEDLLEPELRPEYIKKIKDIQKKGKFSTYSSIEDLKRDIEHA